MELNKKDVGTRQVAKADECKKIKRMKRFVLFLVVLSILAPAAHGQGVALAAMADGPRLTTQSFVDDAPEKEPKGLCTVTTVGIISVGVGSVAAIAGIVLIFSEMGDPGKYANQNTGGNQAVGEAVFVGGIGLLGAGIGMAIGGGVHDIVVHVRYRKHQHSISLIAPRKNQVGLAYNF